ncbi:hypothetical protein H0I83_24710 [Bacillus thuringiensis serovar fukuokaensis]|nr:hypothetical protein [Bacillus thuringiensis]OTW88954.1 hypothetical protein BK710_11350 [Bacillus thuringiensis serovar sumiyoshiensis]OTW95777.1 hypothetical protein BK711_20485 [Bacillus thuringiensis serovar fukuokaensis]
MMMGNKFELKWDLLEDFHMQDEKANEIKARYAEKVEEARQKVVDARSKYEVILQREFAGELVAAEKKKTIADVEKAEAALQLAKEEETKAIDYAHTYASGTITYSDLSLDFNKNVKGEIFDEYAKPLIEKAREALYDYYDALAQYSQLHEDVDRVADYLREMTRKGKGAYYVAINPVDFRKLPKPTDHVLDEVQRLKCVPEGFDGTEEFILDTLAKMHS